MAESEHLCDQDIVEKVSSVKVKKLLLGRHRQGDPFKCGGCTATFTTICCLHLHCIKHNGGGSYYFDSLTKTAFPKYDTTCVYTQVSFLDIISDRQVSIDGDACTESSKPVRISKRIAVRNNLKTKGVSLKAKKLSFSKHRVDQMNDKESMIESTRNMKEDGTEAVKTDLKKVTVPESETEDFLSEEQHEKFPKWKRSHSDAETMAELSGDEHIETNELNNKRLKHSSNDIRSNGENHDIIKVLELPDLNRESDIDQADDHKKDELTASEVLLAISKGDNTNLSRDTTDQKQCSVITSSDADMQTRLGESHQESTKFEKPIVIDRQTRSKRASNMSCTDNDKIVKCETCGKKGTKGMLRYHRYLHMDGKSFTCDVCGLLFQTPRSLAMHKKQHETKEFLCGYCPATFHRKQYLETHLLKHTGENPYMCDLCGKAYRDRSHLKRHIKHIHEQKRDFECDICGEKFFRSDHLKNHRLRHFEANKKCPYCNRMFKHPEDLSRHTRTHTGKKDWYCHICRHGFVAVIPYYTHMAKKHGISREEAKVWKDKCKEEMKNTQHVPKKPTLSGGQSSSQHHKHFQNSANMSDKGVVNNCVSSSNASDTYRVKTNDMSTYVDLPVSEHDSGDKNDSIEENYAEGNLLIKLASASDLVKTYTNEEFLHVQKSVVSDLIQGSEGLESGNQTSEALTADIQDGLTSSETDFNVIIAVNNMEFDGETVMFIDGDQCQSEVIIDN